MHKKSAFKRSRWTPGMVYAVPLSDGTFGYVQAISEAMVNVIDVAISSHRSANLAATPPKLEKAQVISLDATWRQDLNSGRWAALGVVDLVIDPSAMPNQVIIGTGTTVGVKHCNAGGIAGLLEAWHGLAPWNAMFDESYFDLKLAPNISRPSTALVLNSAEREAYRTKEAASDA
ncbi:Imm26 family immunity protein [Polaromonas aquatica]|uniref:Imm26 family immunity protein n=1 Tax=Polaromonas aquatica TaxID=332657 RepID=UPI003D6627BD